MNKYRLLNRNIDKSVSWFVLSVCFVGLYVTSSNDLSIISLLAKYKNSSFATYMGQSLFSGGALGASDIPVLLNIALLLIWPISLLVKRIPQQVRLYAKYCLTTNLVFGIFIIHGLKFVVGRVRPYIVVNNTDLYSPFYTFGEYVPFIDSYSGSLPSGHTAAALSLLPFAYCFLYSSNKLRMILRPLLTITILVFALSMALARVMSLDHFLSDCLLAISFGWIFHSFTFHTFFAMPVRIEHRLNELGGAKVLGLCVCSFFFVAAVYMWRYSLT